MKAKTEPSVITCNARERESLLSVSSSDVFIDKTGGTRKFRVHDSSGSCDASKWLWMCVCVYIGEMRRREKKINKRIRS